METAPRAPGVLLHRLSGPLNALLACGVARRISPELFELSVNDEEAHGGGMATISMWVKTRDGDELFSAWLAVRPGVADGAVLEPSVPLRGMLHPVRFKVRRTTAGSP